MSEDYSEKTALMKIEYIHKLIQILVIAPKDHNENIYAKDALRILYNLANFDHPKFYIPGETVRQARDSFKFNVWGGMICLYYLSKSTKNQELLEFCSESKLQDFEIRDLEQMLRILKIFFKGSSEINEKEELFNNREDSNKVIVSTSRFQGIESATFRNISFPEYINIIIKL